MDRNALKALADRLQPMAAAPVFDGLDIPALCDFLRQCAEQGPAAAYEKAAELCELIAAQHDAYKVRMRINCPSISNPAWTCADAIQSLVEKE